MTEKAVPPTKYFGDSEHPYLVSANVQVGSIGNSKPFWVTGR